MNRLDFKTALSFLLLGIRKYTLFSLFTSLFVMIPFLIIGLTKKPVYVSRATIFLQIHSSPSKLSERSHPPRSLGIEMSILRSNFLAQKIVDSLPRRTYQDLLGHAEHRDYRLQFINLYRSLMRQSPIVLNPRVQAADELMHARMDFVARGMDGLIEIHGEAMDPEISRDLVSTYIDVFKDVSSQFSQEQQRNIEKVLKLQILNARSLLDDSERKLAEFQKKSAKPSRSGAAVNIPDYINTQTQTLKDLRKRRAELLLTYTSVHPDVVVVNQQIQRIEHELSRLQRIRKGPFGEANEIRISKEQWEAFLEGNVKRDRDLLSQMEDEMSTARIVSETDLEKVIVIDPPTLPSIPKMTRGFAIMLLGLVAGTASGAGIPFLYLLYRRPFCGEESLAMVSSHPIAGQIPKLSRKYLKNRGGYKCARVDDNYTGEEYGLFQKAVESMFLRYRQISETEHAQVGKTMTIGNLAISLASWGHRVVLIDGDLLKGRLHQFFSVPNRGGLDERLVSSQSFKIPTFQDKNNLVLIPRGSAKPSIWRTLPDGILEKFIEALRVLAVFILIDAPPILATTDILILSGLADGIFLVVRDRYTLEKDFLKMQSVLESHHVRVLGTVLNESKTTFIKYPYESIELEIMKA
jgi:tyrosine-protein kinase Etk/Wzc